MFQKDGRIGAALVCLERLSSVLAIFAWSVRLLMPGIQPPTSSFHAMASVWLDWLPNGFGASLSQVMNIDPRPKRELKGVIATNLGSTMASF